VLREEEHGVEAVRDERAVGQAKKEMGWQVYATNDLRMDLAATSVVVADKAYDHDDVPR